MGPVADRDGLRNGLQGKRTAGGQIEILRRALYGVVRAERIAACEQQTVLVEERQAIAECPQMICGQGFQRSLS